MIHLLPSFRVAGNLWELKNECMYFQKNQTLCWLKVASLLFGLELIACVWRMGWYGLPEEILLCLTSFLLIVAMHYYYCCCYTTTPKMLGDVVFALRTIASTTANILQPQQHTTTTSMICHSSNSNINIVVVWLLCVDKW